MTNSPQSCSAESRDDLVRFGFASFSDRKFELIVINIKSGEEVMLEGQLRPDQTIEQIDKVLPTCVYVNGVRETDAYRDTVKKIAAVREKRLAELVEENAQLRADLAKKRPETLPGMIAEIYGELDAEDCAMIDREWARMRGYILPADGTSTLIPAPAQSAQAPDDQRNHEDMMLAWNARKAAIEECAQICEGHEWTRFAIHSSPTKSCALAIRALAAQPPDAPVETPPRAWLEAKAEVDAGWPEHCSAASEPVGWRWRIKGDNRWTLLDHYPEGAMSDRSECEPLYVNEPQVAIKRLTDKADEQTTALDQIMTTAADNLAAPNSDLKMTLEFIHHVAEYTLAVTRPELGSGK